MKARSQFLLRHHSLKNVLGNCKQRNFILIPSHRGSANAFRITWYSHKNVNYILFGAQFRDITKGAFYKATVGITRRKTVSVLMIAIR